MNRIEDFLIVNSELVKRTHAMTGNFIGLEVLLDEQPENKEIHPERNLLSAILYRAFQDLTLKEHRRTAIVWFTAKPPKDKNLGFSMKACAEILGYKPSLIRKKAQELYIYCDTLGTKHEDKEPNEIYIRLQQYSKGSTQIVRRTKYWAT